MTLIDLLKQAYNLKKEEGYPEEDAVLKTEQIAEIWGEHSKKFVGEHYSEIGISEAYATDYLEYSEPYQKRAEAEWQSELEWRSHQSA